MKVDWQFLRFPFDDERWRNKAVIGGLLTLFGVIILPLYLPLAGYAVRIMQQTIEGESPSLPEWDDWGELFLDGLRFTIVGIVYNLPALLFLCCAYVLWAFSFPLMSQTGPEPPPEMMFATMIPFFVLMGVGTILSLPLVFLSLVAASRLVAEDSLSSAFQFGEVWRLARVGFGNYLLAIIVLCGFYMLAYTVTFMSLYTIIFACLFPVLLGLLGFYMAVLVGALFGSAYFHSHAEGTVEGVESAA